MSIFIDKLCVNYGGEPVLQDLTLELPDQGVVCVCGPSGCGKTTLLNCLAGLRELDGGAIRGLEDKRVSMVFQDNRLMPWCTALENVAFAVDGDEEKARAMLEAMELAAVADKRPAQLSGGMQRRVAIARAMAYGGDVLLLDEPDTGLDEELAERILSRVVAVCPEKLVVFITHDRELAAKFADSCFYLEPVNGAEKAD